MSDTSQVAPLTLILITGSYPYDVAAEQTFLEPEVRVLVRNFKRVIIAPEQCAGQLSPLPEGVELERGYANFRQSTSGKIQKLLRLGISSLLYQELVDRPALVIQLLALKKLLRFINGAELAKNWVVKFIRDNQLNPRQCIFYTFWFDASSLGIGLAKKFYPDLMLVSRAHGYDLYEWRSPYNYIPCRRQSLTTLEGLFPDSETGNHYLSDRYPKFDSKFHTARLGVSDPGFVTKPSADEVFRILSCSFMVPVKRVDLLMRGIAYAAHQLPDQQFNWHHIGTGPLKDSIAEAAQELLPPNVKSCFPGYSSSESLMQFYRDSPVDLFANVSLTEGTPVAVMEAISCGIPVMATAVGGNVEIVSEVNGKLLSANPTPQEIAATIVHFLENPDLTLEKRKGSRRVWDEKYNSDRNFQAFADQLKAIRS